MVKHVVRLQTSVEGGIVIYLSGIDEGGGMAWHGMAYSMLHVPESRSGWEGGYITIHSASVRDPPHANATRGLLRYSIQPKYIPAYYRCHRRKFLLLKSFSQQACYVSRKNKRMAVATANSQLSVTGNAQAVATCLYLKRRFLIISPRSARDPGPLS